MAAPIRQAEERYPVLARIPDAADLMPRPSKNKAPVETGGYRFDPPQSPQSRHAAITPGTISSYASVDGNGDTITARSRMLATHSPSRFDPSTARPRAAGRSPVLPAFDPFAIPSRRLTDVLGPAI